MPPNNEFCKDHSQMGKDVAVIKNTTTNIDEKLTQAINNWAEHTKESAARIDMIARHDETLKDYVKYKDKVDSLVFKGLIALISVAVMWGTLTTTVLWNTTRVNKLEDMHPRNQTAYRTTGAQGE